MKKVATAVAGISLTLAMLMAFRGVEGHFVSSLVLVLVFATIGMFAANVAEKE